MLCLEIPHRKKYSEAIYVVFSGNVKINGQQVRDDAFKRLICPVKFGYLKVMLLCGRFELPLLHTTGPKS
jgi:hypothetical protein